MAAALASAAAGGATPEEVCQAKFDVTMAEYRAENDKRLKEMIETLRRKAYQDNRVMEEIIVKAGSAMKAKLVMQRNIATFDYQHCLKKQSGKKE